MAQRRIKFVERYREKNPKDTTSLLYSLRQGKFSGHLRSFSMLTLNKDELQDFYAQALGGGIAYESANFRHFNVKVSNYFTYEVGSNLSKVDSLTRLKDRYEVSLFDVENPTNRNDLDRLEELYIRYNQKKYKITYGKQIINTPLLNAQDSRMRPSLMHGFYGSSSYFKNTTIEGGYLYKSSPRSTIKWYGLDNSIGIFSQGVNPDGSKSGYSKNVESNGLLILGVTHILRKQNLKLQYWDYYLDNVFNTLFMQMDYSIPLSKKPKSSKLILGAQFLTQKKINDGGNPIFKKAYFQNQATTTAFSTRLGFAKNRMQITANYTELSENGRFLFPREWGREPFYTFLTRERIEGCGGVKAYMLNYIQVFKHQNLKTNIGLGYYQLPDVKNYALNKYGLPSYFQANIDVRYSIKKGFYKGLEMQWLIAYKKNEGNTYNNDKYIINKVDMLNANWILNYRF